ncbi:flagellar basal-body MS-ring/collar protein FliF [Natronospira bacteriovora]|uniref:Flagellar M-ring protein n=1 Tax=Natronospira bacteriovora TaxID=3069753 RepID=A0ABU0W3D9_9GAMM|nr:flagellar basal-body MS-ring/collar protein FliF [Natronospira sp. AB-CW4]MDQ2068474.1 flagellar basal-body MS-ring/collar protein FliF [Natronospira sp. AB-CW4]
MAVQATDTGTGNLPAEREQDAPRSANQQLQDLVQGQAGRQLGIVVLVAAAIAIAVVAFLWSQSPSYRTLYGDLDDRDAAQVVQALDGAGIRYRINPATGAVEVPHDDLHAARLQLASEGLPRGAGVGFEMMDDESGFGVSQFMERARYHSALQTELSRTINSLDAVQSSRVHLAIPEDSVFVRDRRQPSASVFLNLYRGRSLSEPQVAAIVHMVSSSIPDMPAERVTVVDQRGRLLSDQARDSDRAGTQAQFDHARRLERAYVERIEDILRPIIGSNRVRAQVTADLDFTRFEETRESYDPDTIAVRSEQESEDPRPGRGAQGVPGALTNQPPGLIDEEELAQEAELAGIPAPVARRIIRNYEVDRSVSHTVQALGRIQRLSVAVVVDDRDAVTEEGEPIREPLSEAEIARIENLVREAIGFSDERGDSLSVVNQGFIIEEAEELEEPGFWQQPWFSELMRQLLGAILVLAVIFGVIKPGVRSLAAARRSSRDAHAARGDAAGQLRHQASAGGEEVDQEAKLAFQLSKPQDYDQKVAAAKTAVSEDPKRVAQVVRNWIKE